MIFTILLVSIIIALSTFFAIRFAQKSKRNNVIITIIIASIALSAVILPKVIDSHRAKKEFIQLHRPFLNSTCELHTDNTISFFITNNGDLMAEDIQLLIQYGENHNSKYTYSTLAKGGTLFKRIVIFEKDKQIRQYRLSVQYNSTIDKKKTGYVSDFKYSIDSNRPQVYFPYEVTNGFQSKEQFSQINDSIGLKRMEVAVGGISSWVLLEEGKSQKLVKSESKELTWDGSTNSLSFVWKINPEEYLFLNYGFKPNSKGRDYIRAQWDQEANPPYAQLWVNGKKVCETRSIIH